MYMILTKGKKMIRTVNKLKHVVAHYTDIFCSANEKDFLLTNQNFCSEYRYEHSRYNVLYSKQRDCFVIGCPKGNLLTTSDLETTKRFESYGRACSVANNRNKFFGIK